MMMVRRTVSSSPATSARYNTPSTKDTSTRSGGPKILSPRVPWTVGNATRRCTPRSLDGLLEERSLLAMGAAAAAAGVVIRKKRVDKEMMESRTSQQSHTMSQPQSGAKKSAESSMMMLGVDSDESPPAPPVPNLPVETSSNSAASQKSEATVVRRSSTPPPRVGKKIERLLSDTYKGFIGTGKSKANCESSSEEKLPMPVPIADPSYFRSLSLAQTIKAHCPANNAKVTTDRPVNSDIDDGREIMCGLIDSTEADPLPVPSHYLEHCTDGFSDVRRLGEGAFSQVYMGKDPVLRRKFAVKRLRVRVASEVDVEQARRTFEREIATLKHFKHPNIARMYAYSLSSDLSGDQCLVFELASNGSLHDFLKQGNLREKLPWTTRIQIALDVARALEYLHSGKAGQVCFHQDVKSANICLKRDFTALLIDWGISKMIPENESNATMTIMKSTASGVRGTPGYICPTYARTMKQFESANDVFSLGVVLIEIITGILQDTEVDGEHVDLFNVYSKDGIEKRQLEFDSDEAAGEWDKVVRNEIACLAVECISLNPRSRPKIQDIVKRLNNLAGQAKPWSQGERNSITVLFSSPLVCMDDEGNLCPISESPNFALERDILVQCMTEAKRGIKLSFDVATDDRLQAAATRRCGCLHFSGHGHPNYLLFEDGSGGAHWLGEEELHDLVHVEPFKFVFVSACYSLLMGRSLVKAGVPHVVCCRHDVELRDDAAMKFTRTFYYALAEGYTIKAAFDKGKSAVSKRFAQEEVDKFVLLPEDGNHNLPLFDAEILEWNEEREVGPCIPSPPALFLGREIDLYRLICEVNSRRLVTLVGEVGIGCSSLSLALCRYIDSRKTDMVAVDSVYFVGCTEGDQRNGNAGSSVIFKLHQRLVSEGKVAKPEESFEFDDVSRNIIEALVGTKALLVFDGVENGDTSLIGFLELLFERSKVKVLLTSTKPVHFASPGVTEHIFNLGELDVENTGRLFGKMCPHADTGAKRRDLISKLVNSCDASVRSADPFPVEPIFERLGGGNPGRTIHAAKEMSREEFNIILNASSGASPQTSDGGVVGVNRGLPVSSPVSQSLVLPIKANEVEDSIVEISKTCDLSFVESKEDKEAISQLVWMGFSDGRARCSYYDSGKDLSIAVAMLLSEPAAEKM